MMFLSSNLNFPCGLGVIRSTSGVVVSEEEKEKNRKRKKIIKKRKTKTEKF
jgi:hypothetical protein